MTCSATRPTACWWALLRLRLGLGLGLANPNPNPDPNQVDAVLEVLELTLNGQQFGTASLSFTPHPQPAVLALSPSSGEGY